MIKYKIVYQYLHGYYNRRVSVVKIIIPYLKIFLGSHYFIAGSMDTAVSIANM